MKELESQFVVPAAKLKVCTVYKFPLLEASVLLVNNKKNCFWKVLALNFAMQASVQI